MKLEGWGWRLTLERVRRPASEPYIYVISEAVAFGREGQKSGAPLSSWRSMVVPGGLMVAIESAAAGEGPQHVSVDGLGYRVVRTR